MWNPPPDDDINGIVQHYIIKVQVAESQAQTQYETSSLQFTLTNLQPYCTHIIQVAAFTIAPGPFSEPLTVVTLEDGEIGWLENLAFICNTSLYVSQLLVPPLKI